ncbi:MAG: ParB N-terminal domain-containing protein, partial [Nitrospinota bacterium]
MEMKRKALGRGLDALLDPEEEKAERAPSLLWLPPEVIRSGEHQPRRRFEEEGMEELAASIRARGVLQPLLVRRHPLGGYELVAG